jgi:flagellar motility protein MotE (MotC chaperone)
MTNYHLTPAAPLPSQTVQEAKAKRRKVLEAAAQTRKANYQRFLQRMASLEKTLREKNRRLQVNADLV